MLISEAQAGNVKYENTHDEKELWTAITAAIIP
jgi:hypothetical protein